MPFHVMTPVGVCTALAPRPKSPTGGLHHTPPRGAKACMHCKLPTKFRSSLQHQLREVQNGSDRLTIQKKGTAAPTAMAKKIRQQLRLLNSKRKHGRSDCHGQKDKSAAPTAEVKNKIWQHQLPGSTESAKYSWNMVSIFLRAVEGS